MKQRLDIYLYENNFFESREKSKAIIMSGNIFVNNNRVDKPGYIVKDGDRVEFRGKKPKFVSRGGQKLEKAIDEFVIDLRDKTCMDIGASTGGFTDCMLQNGAQKVFAVDVGYGQLDWKLRNDDRVINLERTNIRYLEDDKIDSEIDFISVDVSFISLRLVLPKVKSLLKDGGGAVCLIKPQFEAGKNQVGKKGVVKDIGIHKQVVRDIIMFAQDDLGFVIKGVSFSPIKGPEGNIEYLMFIKKEEGAKFNIDEVDSVVEISHKNL